MTRELFAAAFCGAGVLALAAPVPAVEIEVSPVVGISQPVEDDGNGYDPGLHLGLGVGARLHALASLQVQGNFHLLNPDKSDDFDGFAWSINVGPLFHVPGLDPLDLVIGPVVGYYRGDLYTTVLGERAGGSQRGYQLGFVGSLFFETAGGLHIGPSVSYVWLYPTEVCGEVLGARACDDNPDGDGDGVFTVGLSLRF